MDPDQTVNVEKQARRCCLTFLNGGIPNGQSIPSGGVIRQLLLLARLQSSGYLDDVYVVGTKMFERDLADYEISAELFPTGLSSVMSSVPFYISWPISTMLAMIESLYYIVRYRGRFLNALVICGSDYFFDTMPSWWSRIWLRSTKRVHYLHHLHEHWRSRPGNRVVNFVAWSAQRISLRIISRCATHVFVYDNAMGDVFVDLLTCFGYKGKLLRYRGGVDLPKIDAVVQNTRDPLLVSYFGRLMVTKGMQDLVEIWKNVVKHIPDARLQIIGPSPPGVRKTFEHALRQVGIEHSVTVHGFLEDPEHIRMLKKSVLMINPSHEEGWCFTIMEAMACSLPCVAYDLPAYGRAYGETLRKVRCYDIELFAGAVVEMLQDVQLRLHYAKLGRGHAEKHNWRELLDAEIKSFL